MGVLEVAEVEAVVVVVVVEAEAVQAEAPEGRGLPRLSAGQTGVEAARPWITCQPTRRCQGALRLVQLLTGAPQTAVLVREDPSRSTTQAVAPLLAVSHLHPPANNSPSRLRAGDHTHLQV